jgi:FKBP-type peptidyl-prolyl cis-trans isomerase FkpA
MEMKKLFGMTLLAMGLLLTACGGGGSTPGSTETVTTLQVIDTTVGTGATAVSGSNVTVHYTGWLYDAAAPSFHGTLFDSSVGKAPFTFKLGAGQVITGWDQGVAGMKVGGIRTLIIPSSMAYGSAGRGVIPPNATLVFNVELQAVQVL